MAGEGCSPSIGTCPGAAILSVVIGRFAHNLASLAAVPCLHVAYEQEGALDRVQGSAHLGLDSPSALMRIIVGAGWQQWGRWAFDRLANFIAWRRFFDKTRPRSLSRLRERRCQRGHFLAGTFQNGEHRAREKRREARLWVLLQRATVLSSSGSLCGRPSTVQPPRARAKATARRTPASARTLARPGMQWNAPQGIPTLDASGFSAWRLPSETIKIRMGHMSWRLHGERFWRVRDVLCSLQSLHYGFV